MTNILVITRENSKFIATNSQNDVVAKSSDINSLLERLIKKSTAKIKQQGEFKVQLQNITGEIIYYCNRGILITNQEQQKPQQKQVKNENNNIEQQLKSLQYFANSYCSNQTQNAHVRSHSIHVTNYATAFHSQETKRIDALKDAIETLKNPQFFRNCIYAHERNQRALKEIAQPYAKQETQKPNISYSSNPYDLGSHYNAIAESNRLVREREENEKIMDEVRRGLRY